MKKIILLFLILSGWFICWAPTPGNIIIPSGEIEYPYNATDPILRSFIKLESNFDQYAENPVTGARGILQFLPPMIEEANRILEEYDLPEIKYTWEDAWNPITSINIWYIVQSYHNPEYDIQRACQIWFGIGIQWDGMTWKDYYSLILILKNNTNERS